MQKSSISVVGADAVGKTSFVLALGAKEVATNATQQREYIWPRPDRKGRKIATTVRILRCREEAPDGDGVFVLLFNLTRRDSLAAVIAQWAHLSDVTNRKLFLVGTHADSNNTREIALSEVREISGEFHSYEEVCCRPGDEGILRVQHTLTQWTTGGSAEMASDIPLARASICGGFPRPVVTMMMPNTSHSLPASPAGRRSCMRSDVWLYDPTEVESASASPVATAGGGDVKLRTISKAIYDIRGAVAEKSKALAKYRDRQMSHWLTRSRYFGPTESSRHKRWQEEQKKRQQAHSHLHHVRQQSSTLDERTRSVSHPDKFVPPRRKSVAQRGPGHLSSSSESEESPGTPLEHKSFMQPTELTKQRQPQHEASNAQEQKKRLATKRALRKQRRAASNDIFERSTASAAAYLDCYDEMDMPLQFKPLSPSLGGRASLLIPSPASSVASSSSRRSFGGERKAFEVDAVTAIGAQQSFELVSPGAKQVGCLPALLPMTHLQSPVPPIMSPSAPTSSVQSHHSVADSSLDSPQFDSPSVTVLKLYTPDKLQIEAKSELPSPAKATDNVTPKIIPPPAPPQEDSTVSRANTMCSSSSENFDCSDIDDLLEYFEGVTLPIS